MAPTQKILDAVPTGLFIGGAWRDATDGATLDVEDPATGEVPGRGGRRHASPTAGPRSTPRSRRRRTGPRRPPRERGEILRAAFELVTERADDFALLMTLEMGKPLAESRGEVTYGAEFFRWFSEEAVRIAGAGRPRRTARPG